MKALLEYIQKKHITKTTFLEEIESIISQYITPVLISKSEHEYNKHYKDTDWEVINDNNYAQYFIVDETDWEKLQQPIFNACKELAANYNYTVDDMQGQTNPGIEIINNNKRMVLFRFIVSNDNASYYISVLVNKEFFK